MASKLYQFTHTPRRCSTCATNYYIWEHVGRPANRGISIGTLSIPSQAVGFNYLGCPWAGFLYLQHLQSQVATYTLCNRPVASAWCQGNLGGGKVGRGGFPGEIF